MYANILKIIHHINILFPLTFSEMDPKAGSGITDLICSKNAPLGVWAWSLEYEALSVGMSDQVINTSEIMVLAIATWQTEVLHHYQCDQNWYH